MKIRLPEKKLRALMTFGLVWAFYGWSAPTAKAGYWEFVPLPPDSSATFLQEAAKRYAGTDAGTFSDCSLGYPNPPVSHDRGPYTWSEYMGEFDSPELLNGNEVKWASGTGGGSQGVGGAAQKKAQGTIRSQLRWVRNNIQNSQGAFVPDPEDNPLPYVYFDLDVAAIAVGYDRNPFTGALIRSGYTLSASLDNVPPAVGSTSNAPVSAVTTEEENWTLKSARTQRLIKVATDGDTLWTPAIGFTAQADLDDNRSTVGVNSVRWNEGLVWAYADYKLSGRDVNLYISSDIEKSYKKVTDSADLPIDQNSGLVDTKKIRDSTPIVDPIFVGPPSTTGVSSLGPWAVECKPRVDGVHNVATWIKPTSQNAPINTPGWYGIGETGGNVTANILGFVTPSYQWSLNGGSPEGNISTELAKNSATIDLGARGIGPDVDSYYASGINLGGVPNALSTHSSTVSVKVTETNPAYSNLVLDDKYKINWHLPCDWSLDATKPTVKAYDWDRDASDWTTANALTSIHRRPTQKSLGLTWGVKAASYAVNAGSVYVGTAGTSAPLSLSVPEAAAGALLLYGVSLAIIEAAPPTPTDPDPIPITYGMWKAAVNDQVTLNTNRANATPDNTTDRVIGLSSSEVLQAQQILDEDTPQNDDNWDSGDLEIKCMVAQSYEETFYLGDLYDGHGFNGQQPGKVHQQKQIYPVYVFRLKTAVPVEPTPFPYNNPNGGQPSSNYN